VTVHFRTCPLCEATCGLAIETEGDQVVSIRGDEEDVFSHGYLCPKAYALKELHHDPDRLRAPRVRRGGQLVPATWEEAFEEIGRRLPPILAAGGPDAVGVYLGNPTVHNLSLLIYSRALLKVLRSANVFTASTVDQMPKQVSAGLMFGTPLSIPIPDLDRCDHLLVLGANPFVSNGSLMTVADAPGKLRALRARGGQLIVVDPQRTRTAREATRHVAIRPGGDAHLLFAMVQVLFAEKRVRPGKLAEHLRGGDLERIEELSRGFTPEMVAGRCGVDPGTIRELARGLADARHPVVYGRIGTCTQAFGTLASWLVDVLNVLVGALDAEGGALFTRAAAGSDIARDGDGRGRGLKLGRRRSRVRGAPEVCGELPVACLAEEIETPGPGQIRALVTIAGNPVLSTPNGGRLEKAIAGLDFMLSLDIYLNETTRHADVVLPGLSPLEQSHYDLALRQLSVRNVATWSPPIFAPPEGHPPEWHSLLRLLGVVLGAGSDVAALDALVAGQLAAGAPLPEGRVGPERIVELMLRAGPYRLTLADLEAAPHGIDLGPLEPRLPGVLRTPSGKIELAPEPIVADVPRLLADLEAPLPPLTLVGRRDLRSNNSWMHNLEVLVKGPERCTLRIHPDDAARLGVTARARVRSRVGEVELPVEITLDIRPGVVSIPHGWGHGGMDGMRVAARHAGVSSNLLADELQLDPLSGNAVLCGIPVEVEPAPATV
jgi:anaerobic selenocysteine-containing dehydrogenase